MGLISWDLSVVVVVVVVVVGFFAPQFFQYRTVGFEFSGPDRIHEMHERIVYLPTQKHKKNTSHVGKYIYIYPGSQANHLEDRPLKVLMK